MSRKKRQVVLQPGERIELDSSVKIEPADPQEPTQTHQEFRQGVIGKMAESLDVPSDLPDYESPSYSSAKVHMQAIKEASESPIPREDEARPCTLCESRRPIGTSYSRVYCTKSNARYCKCSYCGHTWTQERK
jgi:formate dehydrogenase maturation protein FdhE